jgi:hypothetical protein
MIVSGIPFSGERVKRYAVFFREKGKVRSGVVLSVNPLSSTPDMFVVAELFIQWSHKGTTKYLKEVIDNFLKSHPTFMEDFTRTPPPASLV